jgi:hypothetical protein
MMEDLRIGNLLFTEKCDIAGTDALTLERILLGKVAYQVVDLSAFTVRYVAIKDSSNTYLVPAELINDFDDGLIFDFTREIVAKLIPLPKDLEKEFNRQLEVKIHTELNATPYWEEESY